jgi:hypothetical protein
VIIAECSNHLFKYSLDPEPAPTANDRPVPAAPNVCQLEPLCSSEETTNSVEPMDTCMVEKSSIDTESDAGPGKLWRPITGLSDKELEEWEKEGESYQVPNVS